MENLCGRSYVIFSFRFQDRGLISELRSHLRRQMIAALRNTSLDPGRFRPSSVSPKLQALNLLVAEFLLQNNYHYTLSVFSSEVPLLANVPEFSASICASGIKTELSEPPRFQRSDVRDILQTLGVIPDSQEGQKIFNLYHDSAAREPLLKCILNVLPRRCNKNRRTNGNTLEESESDRHSQTENGEITKSSIVSVSRNGINGITGEVNKMRSQHGGDTGDKRCTADLRRSLMESHMENQRIVQLQDEMKR